NGGSGKFSYQWDNGENAASATKLTPGKHTVTVADANGCSATASVDISENILPLSVVIEETGKIKCAGDKTSLKATVAGGKAPFQYSWNASTLSGDQPANVIAGDYQLTVSDASGKTATAKISVVQPASMSLIATVQSPASAGNSDGKAVAQPRGGTSPYIFAWDNGESTANAVRLGPGKHVVTATDANGCTALATFDLSENILPLAVQVEVQGKIKCASETAGLKVNISGGKGPFQFNWNSPALQGAAPTGVPAGDYQLTVTDAQGKTQTATASIKAPAALSLEVVRNIGATTDRSNDGRVLVKATGGTGAINYAWDNGETSAQTQKLGMGIHHVTATDANGCTLKADVEVKQRILPALTAGQLQSGQTIRMEQLRFEADSSSINESCLPVLNELYDFLSENGGIVIEIGGHTNSTPPDEFCDRLSTARAKSVADYLIAKGIAPQRVAYKGYGKRKPIASNSTAEGRKMNQRVEIKILKIEN
ncbi:MAG TPA: OmpA family protein, partial [Saprospiraceae bacterium]|nr:OmpA family protein [Saprospiraceae bacterium]